jgi:hypothetical protein
MQFNLMRKPYASEVCWHCAVHFLGSQCGCTQKKYDDMNSRPDIVQPAMIYLSKSDSFSDIAAEIVCLWKCRSTKW